MLQKVAKVMSFLQKQPLSDFVKQNENDFLHLKCLTLLKIDIKKYINNSAVSDLANPSSDESHAYLEGHRNMLEVHRKKIEQAGKGEKDSIARKGGGKREQHNENIIIRTYKIKCKV